MTWASKYKSKLQKEGKNGKPRAKSPQVENLRINAQGAFSVSEKQANGCNSSQSPKQGNELKKEVEGNTYESKQKESVQRVQKIVKTYTKNLQEFPGLADVLSSASFSARIQKPLPLRGLTNSFNHCFRNAVLQGLSSLEEFTKVFDGLSSLEFPPEHTSFLRIYTAFHKEMWRSNTQANASAVALDSKSSPASPERDNSVNKTPSRSSRRRRRRAKNLANPAGQGPQPGSSKKQVEVVLKAYNPAGLQTIIEAFQRQRIGQQEDVQEFFNFLIRELHTEMLTVLESAKKSCKSEQKVADDDGWNEVGKKGKSAIVRSEIRMSETPISRIFGGNMRLELNRRGMKNTVSMQPFHALHLDVHQLEVESVDQALAAFMTPGRIEGLRRSNGSEVNASQHVSISPPLALVLHLKRFNYEQKQGSGEKIEKHVQFPLKLKLPKRFLCGIRSVGEFELKSIIVHHGNRTSGGHYTTYVKRKDKCYHFDDLKVYQVPMDVMLRQQAYLLFYETVTSS
mmetsp:Transcript_22346/g.31287  ORF Transcript_22346/g.31287 Transcript_22346/m.31287 type:complete len:511 (+) Transcript_22346:53-1585(+)